VISIRRTVSASIRTPRTSYRPCVIRLRLRSGAADEWLHITETVRPCRGVGALKRSRSRPHVPWHTQYRISAGVARRCCSAVQWPVAGAATAGNSDGHALTARIIRHSGGLLNGHLPLVNKGQAGGKGQLLTLYRAMSTRYVYCHRGGCRRPWPLGSALSAGNLDA
jgi:hypothetical protein